MAQRVQVILVDDMDGTAAHETVRFDIDGEAYEMDLSHENAQKLRESLLPFVRVAHRRRPRIKRKPVSA